MFAAVPPAVHEGALRAYVAGASHRGLRPDDLDRLGRRRGWTPTGSRRSTDRSRRPTRRYTDEVEPRYGEIDLPVLVVWGTDDTWIPVDRAHRLAGMIPGAELRLIEDAGHLIQLDQPVALATTLTSWLRDRVR